MRISDSVRLADGERFAVGSSTMAAFVDSPRRIDGGVIMVCRGGSARITVDLRSYGLHAGSSLFLLPGKILTISDVTADFSVDYFAFSRELFEEASFRIDHYFFRFLSNNPHYDHSERSLQMLDLWMHSAGRLYDDRGHTFRDTIIKNRLQNLFLDICDAIRRNNIRMDDDALTGRQNELFHKYILLVREHFREQHDVAYYAGRMFITTRYLSTVVRNVAGESPKSIIDRMIVLEIKVLLMSTNLSVQEIAARLHFPDQSYMGRYFRKHTGQSPTRFRNKN